MNFNWTKLIGAVVAIIGGILFVFNLPDMNLIPLGIGLSVRFPIDSHQDILGRHGSAVPIYKLVYGLSMHRGSV